MSTNHHTPLAFRAALQAAILNAPLGQLDAAISAVILTGSGVATSLTSNANAGQAVLNVASVAGFAVGDSVFIGRADLAPESRLILSIGASSITLTTNLASTHTTGAPVSKSPVELLLARGGQPTLDHRLDLLDAADVTLDGRLDAYDAELGANPSGTHATVAARLGVMEFPGALRFRRQTTAQTITTGTTQTLVCNASVREDDENGDFSYSTSTGILTIVRAGWYHLTAGVLWELNATGQRRLGLMADGVRAARVAEDAAAVIEPEQNVAALVYLPAAATALADVFQNSGADRTIQAQPQSFFAAVRVR